MIRRKTFILSFGWSHFSSRSKSWGRESFYSRHRTNKCRSRSWDQNKLSSTRQPWLEELSLLIACPGNYQGSGVMALADIFSVVLGKHKGYGRVMNRLQKLSCSRSLSWTRGQYRSRCWASFATWGKQSSIGPRVSFSWSGDIWDSGIWLESWELQVTRSDSWGSRCRCSYL